MAMNRDVWLSWEIGGLVVRRVDKLEQGGYFWEMDGCAESRTAKLDIDSCLDAYVRRKVSEFMRYRRLNCKVNQAYRCYS